jgi:hypothetical protein
MDDHPVPGPVLTRSGQRQVLDLLQVVVSILRGQALVDRPPVQVPRSPGDEQLLEEARRQLRVRGIPPRDLAEQLMGADLKGRPFICCWRPSIALRIWMLSITVLPWSAAAVVSIEKDSNLATHVCAVAWPEWLHIVVGDAAEIALPHDSFDLIFADTPIVGGPSLDKTISILRFTSVPAARATRRSAAPAAPSAAPPVAAQLLCLYQLGSACAKLPKCHERPPDG